VELLEANRLIALLEQQYFEMHHRANEAEVKLVSDGAGDIGGLRARLAEMEREKLAILARIAQIEDGLLDEE
jgi:hypothetical protein